VGSVSIHAGVLSINCHYIFFHHAHQSCTSNYVHPLPQINPSSREKSHGSNSKSQNTGKSPLIMSPPDPTPPERPTVLSIVVPPSSLDPPWKSKRLPPPLVHKPTCWDNTPLIAPSCLLSPTSTLPLMVRRGVSQERIL